MKAGWKVKLLSEVCSFYNGKAHEKSINENGKYKVVNSKFVSSNGQIAKRTEIAQFPLLSGDIVLVMSDVPNGKTLAKCFLIDKDDEYTLNQRICAIRTNNFDKRFLYFQLNRNQHFLDFDNGENQTNLRKDDILNCKLLIPPLPEQKRIVSILDKAFAAIDKAIANTTKNLQNTKELFDSYLNEIFSNPGDDWEKKKLGKVCEKIFAGGDKPKNNFSKEKTEKYNIPIFSNGIKNKGLYGYTDILKVEKSSVTVSARGTIGYAEIRENGFYPIIRLIVLIPDINIIDLRFLKYVADNLDFINSGVAIPQLTVPMIRNYKIILPPLSLQKLIVAKLNSLSSETKRLESIYQQKLDNLKELKQSILQKAFEGEL
ncbi:MAG: restriction endonuclease subunit S [FCB group bacterium]|nr:restriction endonuclease subunit S [FCB group bacterium]